MVKNFNYCNNFTVKERTMGVLVQCLILSLLITSHLFFKILTTPKFDSDEVPEEASSWFSNFSSHVTMNISSCHWMSIAFKELGTVWISGNKTQNFGITIHDNGQYIEIWGVSIRFEFPKSFFVPDKWFFLCFTYNNENKRLEVYLNSEKVFEEKIKDHLDTFVIEKDFLQYARFGKVGRFAGQLTDLNMWSTILHSSEIKDLYICKVLKKKPDIVAWKSSNVISGMYIIVSDEITHPCDKQTESEIVVYDVNINMEPAGNVLRVCDSLGGTMEPPSSKMELEIIEKKVRRVCKTCNDIWIPIFKKSKEVWVDGKNEIALHLPWHKGQPNGGKYETCASMWVDNLSYYDVPCAQAIMFYCQIKDFQVFQLRGMCAENKGEIIDRKYVLRLENILNGRPAWRGFSSNSIQWSNNKTRWEITNTARDEIIVSFAAKEFPIGKSIWELESSNICQENTEGLKVELMFSNCGQFEFSCSDGTCIPIQKKCNFVPDCWDKGDEIDCQLLNNKDMGGYDSNLPDIVLDSKGKIMKKMLKPSVTIEEIKSIEEVKSRYTATFNLKLEWTDSRLTWYDLHEDLDLNILSEEQKKNIWFPKILIANTEENIVEIPNDSQSKLSVSKNGSLTMSSTENLQESALYDGKENNIIYSRQFTEKLKCVFDLSFFPFDTQTCSIVFNSGKKERNLIELVGIKVEFSGNKKLSTFDVIRSELEENLLTDDIDLKVNIILKRQVSQHLLGIYLPSLFIMIIAQVPSLYDRFN